MATDYNRKTPAPLVISNAYLLPRPYRNFEGRADKFNAEGFRNFTLLIDPEQAQNLIEDGWHIKVRTNQDGEDSYMLKVKVRWHDNVAPENDSLKLYLINPDARTKTLITPETASVIDFAQFQNVDLIIVPNHYDVNGNEGNSAYLREGYFTLESSPFGAKYADYEDTSAADSDAPWDE